MKFNKIQIIKIQGFLILPVLLLGVALTQAADPKKTLNYMMRTEPPQLNTVRSTDSESGFILGHLMQGLTTIGKTGKAEPGVAEKWEIKGLNATFHLRKNAKWSDGKPVTAHDFEFAWKTVLDPKTASEYAFLLYPIKNAEAINKGKKPLAELGVKAVDDTTLAVALEKPCAYFDGLVTFQTTYPVREDIYNKFGDKYGADADKMVFNGPFVLTKWVHGAELILDKNPNFWDKASIKLDRIAIPYISPDNNAQFNFFKDKKIDVVDQLSSDDLPKAQAQKYKIQTFSDGSVWYLEFNNRAGRATANKNLRKAIKLVFDSKEYVQRVVRVPGTKPGLGLIPSWMRGQKSMFRTEYPIKYSSPNIAEAKKLIAEAKKELGGTIPSLVFLTDDTPFAGRSAEFFQSLFKTNLGVDLKIDKQIFKQRLAKMLAGDFDIVAAGWGPDYNDPMTFAELKTSWNENNRGKYNNPKYDALITKALESSDQKVRLNAMAEAEKILLEQDVGIVMTYERIKPYVTHPWVQGVVRRAVGFDPDFTHVSLNK